jgi:hypothetical protein
MTKKKVLFHQANAPTPILVAAAKLVELSCKLFPHPPYSQDLAPLQLFPVSEHEKNGSVEKDSHRTPGSLPKLKSI